MLSRRLGMQMSEIFQYILYCISLTHQCNHQVLTPRRAYPGIYCARGARRAGIAPRIACA
eukprot:SAG31_NODE_2911_length_4921_cov_2.526752_2_plen_60_part_00